MQSSWKKTLNWLFIPWTEATSPLNILWPLAQKKVCQNYNSDKRSMFHFSRGVRVGVCVGGGGGGGRVVTTTGSSNTKSPLLWTTVSSSHIYEDHRQVLHLVFLDKTHMKIINMFPISSHIRKWHYRHPQPSMPHHIFSHICICISLPVIKAAYALNWTGLFWPLNRRGWRGGKSPNQYTESLDTHLVMHCLICSKKCEVRAQLCLRLDSDASCCHCQVGAAVHMGNGPVWGL